MSVQFSLAGEVALVTGGATGLGRAIASAFGRAGATIALHDLTPERADAACAALRAGGISCHPYAADVRDGAAVAAAVAAIERDHGHLDLAVANAGIYPNTPFLDLAEEEWRRVIHTNLTGTFNTCQAAARAMVRGGRGGRIIALSSGAANSAIWGWSHYCASKAGVVLLTRGMALELAPHNIRVNSILPGYIDVPEGGAHLAPAYKDRARSTVPLGRPGTPDDIADAALLLASPLSSYITGTTLVVDGGTSAGRVGLRPAGE
jgi:NAD(P)-dependent dehydrogenase (short-subunit alcohol dehydrogenase family)